MYYSAVCIATWGIDPRQIQLGIDVGMFVIATKVNLFKLNKFKLNTIQTKYNLNCILQ